MNIEEAVKKYKEIVDGARIDNFGGYPSVIDHETIPGYVVIASVVDGGPRPDLDIYTVEQFLDYVGKMEKEWGDDE
jgi:hypothetical protein